MAVVRGLRVDGAAQVQLVDDVGRLEAEHAVDRAQDARRRHRLGVERVEVHADRIGVADGVGELQLAACGEAGRHDVLRHPAAHVGGAAVDLRRILARERAAAVPAHAAVAVDDDLAAGEAGVALRAADDEAAGGIDEELRLVGQQALGQHLPDDVLDAELLDVGVLGVGGVLRGNDHVRDGDRLAVLVDDRHLRLGVGTQPRARAALADLRELAAEAVREHDRRRHQLGRVVAGVAEHQALVAGALLGGLLALGLAGIDALGDVGRLLGHQQVDEHLVGVEHVVVVDVADFADRRPGDLLEVELRFRRDFAADHDHVRLDERLTGDPAVLVDGEAGVEHRVGNRVGDLVRMAFADGLRREDESIGHNAPTKKPAQSRAAT